MKNGENGLSRSGWRGFPMLAGFALFSFFIFSPGWSAAQLNPVIIDLTSPNEVSFGEFGAGVTGIPDLTGDGVGDVAIGAFHETANTFVGAGMIHVYNGATGAFVRTLISPNAETSGRLGDSLRGLSDANADGKGDIIGGARQDDVGVNVDAGKAYLYSGLDGSLLWTFQSPNAQNGGLFSDDVGWMPDVDGDGKPDILINAPMDSPGGSPLGCGRVYLFSSATKLLLRQFASPLPQTNGNFNQFYGISDLDGDGRGDVIIGAPGEDRLGNGTRVGRVYIFSGLSGARLYTLDSPNPEAGGEFGEHDWSIPDLNGDGKMDVIVGAPYESPDGLSQAGRAYVYSCNGPTSGTLLLTLKSPYEQAGGWFGFHVMGIPDFDGDGKGDLVIGAPLESDGSSPQYAGRVYIFSGATGKVLRVIKSPHETFAGKFGIAIDRIPNIGTAGSLGLVIGASEENGVGVGNSGRAYIVLYVNAARHWDSYQ